MFLPDSGKEDDMASDRLIKRSFNRTPFDKLISDIFEGVFDQYAWDPDGSPRSNVTTTQAGYRIELEVPGMKKGDFDVSVDGDTLRVAASVGKRDGNSAFSRSFTRAWTLETSVIRDAITASYADGILTIEIPTRAPPTKERLTIEVK